MVGAVTQAAENRLKGSASPYLRSAAHQPVDWHEWGEEAFAKARAAGMYWLYGRRP